MKIGQPSDKPVSANSAAPAVSAKSGQSPSTTSNSAAARSASSPGVAVTVSTLARTLGETQRGETADVDAEKVNAVRLAVQQGTYKVNAEAIADKLLANAQEMLNRNRN